MHDKVARLQLGEVDVEHRAGGNRVRRLEPARSLDLVTAKDFGIGDDDKFGLSENEAPCEGAKVDPWSVVRGP